MTKELTVTREIETAGKAIRFAIKMIDDYLEGRRSRDDLKGAKSLLEIQWVRLQRREQR